MALRQREVIGTIVDGDGNPVTGAEVKFQPTEKLAYTSTHVIVDAPFVVTTDGSGNFSITLWCDEDSLVAVNYNVYFPPADGGLSDVQHVASFSLEYGDASPINIAELISGSIPAPSPSDLLYTFIEQTVNDSNRIVSRIDSTTTPALVATDLGKEIRTTNNSAVTMSVPSTSDLGTDFICAVCQLGNGQITFDPVFGVMIQNLNGHSKTAGQYSTVSLRAIGTDEYILMGETAA